MDFYDIFRKCLKWDKEQVISFWEEEELLIKTQQTYVGEIFRNDKIL